MKKLLISLLLIPYMAFSQLDIYGMSFEEDKVMHYLSGVAITSLAHDLIYEETKSKEKAVLYSMATAMVIGTLKEIADQNFDGDDLSATMYGAITVGFVINIDDLFRKRRK